MMIRQKLVRSISGLFCMALPAVSGISDSAQALAAGFSSDPPWSSERISQLPPPVRETVLDLCAVRPTAGRYFATYLNGSKLVRLHYDQFRCDGAVKFRKGDSCLYQEFALAGSHYRLVKSDYRPCFD